MSDISSSTVDTNKLQFFDDLSSEWWGKNSPVKALHSVSPFLVGLIQDHFTKSGLVKKQLVDTPTPLKDISILDVGCGGGFLSEPLAKMGGTVHGLDINPGMINIAKQHAALDASLSNLTYAVEAIEDHCSKNAEKYDAVVSSYVLEYVNDHELFLESCAKCVKPGGSIFITCIGKTMISWLVGIVLYENILGIVPRGAHDWNKFITAENTQRILEKNNCKAKLVRGTFYNLFTKQWSLIGNTSFCYIVHVIKEK